MRYFVFTITLLLVTGPCFNQVSAKDTVRNTVSAILDKAKKDGEKITLPENKYAEEGLSAAENTSETFNSPDFQERLQCEQQRLETEVLGDFITSWKNKDAVEEQSGQTGNLGKTERVYLFFSSSVPDETIRAYLSAIAGADDPNLIPVMRGFVGGLADMASNTEYFSRILKKDHDCLDIPTDRCRRYQLDIKLKPSLFAQYGITRVPAVVYEKEENGFLIQGDAGLDYLLERINREANSPSLDKLIRKMRDGNERAE